MSSSISIEQNHYIFSLAKLMIRMNARACLVAQTLGVSEAEARKWYREIRGTSSPSGQQPSDLRWYLKTPDRRYYGALLLSLYSGARQTMASNWALVHAYKHFAMMTGGIDRGSEKSQVLPFSRANYLVQMFKDQSRLHAGGESNRHKTAVQLDMRKCRSCNTLCLFDINDANRVCPLCDDEKHHTHVK